MALAAAQVVDAIAARLVPLAATAGRVYTSRAWPLDEASLPAWRVTAEAESVMVDAIGEPLNRHDLSVAATAVTRAVSDLDNALHSLAAGGLALLFAPTVPYGLRLSAIERRMASEGEAAVGHVTLRLETTYWVNPATPETIYA